MFSKLAYSVFEQSIQDYHQFDNVDQPINNPFPKDKFEHLLYNKSDAHELVDDLLRDAEINEFEIAYQLWQKRFVLGTFNQLEQKQILRGMRFLQNRGFSFDIINQVIAKIKQD